MLAYPSQVDIFHNQIEQAIATRNLLSQKDHVKHIPLNSSPLSQSSRGSGKRALVDVSQNPSGKFMSPAWG